MDRHPCFIKRLQWTATLALLNGWLVVRYCGTADEPGAVQLGCGAHGTITAVTFAEFGKPSGGCDSTPLGPGACGSHGLAGPSN